MEPTWLEQLKAFGLRVGKQVLASAVGELESIDEARIRVVVGDLYDRAIEPIDLPGPDAAIDPYLRQVVVGLAVEVRDALVAWAAPLTT